MMRRNEKRRQAVFAAALAAVLGVSSSFCAFAGAKQIIRMDGGDRVEMKQEYAEEEYGPGAGSKEQIPVPDTVRMWGPVLSVADGSFSIDSQGNTGFTGEVVVHIDPEQTLILDSMTGFPVGADKIQAGESIYVYVGPAMAMSLPPQATAVLVLVDIPQDAGAPLYLTASESLAEDGQGGYVLKAADGQEFAVPADCPITPYMTRQMVRLSDIGEGRRLLMWTGTDGKAAKIVLFNE